MVIGFEIYGALGTSVALLNVAQQGIKFFIKTCKDYQKVGYAISEAERKCDALCLLINNWKEFEGLDRRMSDESYKGLWGDDWHQIKRDLNATELKFADFTNMVHEKLPPTFAYERIPNDFRERAEAHLKKQAGVIQVYSTPKSELHKSSRTLREAPMGSPVARRIRKQRAEQDYITKMTPSWVKVKFILSYSKRLTNELRSLTESFEELQRIVHAATPLDLRRGYSGGLTSGQRLVAKLSLTQSPVREEAKKNRPQMKSLYKCCSTSRQFTELKLELDILKREGGVTRGKKFPMLTPRFEIVAEILGDDAPSHELTFRDNFDDACKKVHEKENGQCLLRTGVTSGNARSRTWFHLRKGNQTVPIRESHLVLLNIKLQNLARAERLELAYKVVESALLLLGTTWLAALSSATLKRFQHHGDGQRNVIRYFVDLDPERNSFLGRLQDGGKNLHIDIFTVGAVLAEIALGRVITKVVDSGSGLEMRMADNSRQYSLRKVISDVKGELGEEYSEAVKFCLQDPNLAPNRQWNDGVLYGSTITEEEMSIELVDLFYSEAFVR